MNFKNSIFILFLSIMFSSCADKQVLLSHGVDQSAGGDSTYIIQMPAATYYLEKSGGGLSSMLDPDGVDWIGFNKEAGTGHKGEYRGFPNAIHKQDGSYFHAMNAGTDHASSVVELEEDNHVRVLFTSDNEQWQGQWDFYADRCDFTMKKVSPGYHYWVQYEGVAGGQMDSTDYWYASANNQRHSVFEPFMGDLPAPEWMAFGDEKSPRMLYVLHHEDDDLPDNYVGRPFMTVLGFGRNNGDKTTKHLNTVQSFSIGFAESTGYSEVEQAVKKLAEKIE